MTCDVLCRAVFLCWAVGNGARPRRALCGRLVALLAVLIFDGQSDDCMVHRQAGGCNAFVLYLGSTTAMADDKDYLADAPSFSSVVKLWRFRVLNVGLFHRFTSFDYVG